MTPYSRSAEWGTSTWSVDQTADHPRRSAASAAASIPSGLAPFGMVGRTRPKSIGAMVDRAFRQRLGGAEMLPPFGTASGPTP